MSNGPPPQGGYEYPGRNPINVPQPGHDPRSGPKKNSSFVIVVLLALIGGGLLVALVLTTLAVHGVRKYIANAKQAEARNSLGQIARNAIAAADDVDALGTSLPAHGRVCPSVRSPVPSSLEDVSGKKYKSTALQWQADPGWSCLHFALSSPQYYQYSYTSTPVSFAAMARGDLDGDGRPSTFELDGRLENGLLHVAPAIKEIDPDE